MYNALFTLTMIVLTLVAVGIISYCVRKIKKDIQTKPESK